MKLSKDAEEFVDVLLKYYPIDDKNTYKPSHNHAQHQKPQQHFHDYRKVDDY